MDFAKKQLEKYGWREGKGLGKNEDGLSTALKPKLKFDNSGVGHDIGEQYTNKWWENVYNNALNNIEVGKKVDGEISMSLKNKGSVDITTKSYVEKQLVQSKQLEYGSFIKTSKLTENGIVNFESRTVELTVPKIAVLNDEELFAACGGRTAHKGARHGLKLSGKLSRIEKQEKMLLKKLQNVSICDEKKDIEKKMKKITKHKDKSKIGSDMEDGLGILSLEDDSRSSTSSTTRKKKKKRGRKSVSFSETVTEYHTQDLDSSIQSNDSNEVPVVLTVVEKSQIKDEEVNNVSNDCNILDEGIEQDIVIEGGNNEDCDHKSFEEAQCSNTEKLSKAELRLKKKNRATLRFLQEINKPEVDEEALVDLHDGCKKCKKRKHLDVEELEEEIHSKRYCEFQGGNKNKHKKMKDKKKKKKQARKNKQEKREEKRINSIAKSLDQICKISDRE